MTSASESTQSYYLPREIALMQINSEESMDCWLTCRGVVYEIHEYIKRQPQGFISTFLMAHAGKDIGHWFEPNLPNAKAVPPVDVVCTVKKCYPPVSIEGLRLRRYVDPDSGKLKFLLPFTVPRPPHTKFALVPRRCDWDSGPDVSLTIRSLPKDPCDSNATADDNVTVQCWSDLEHIFNSKQYRRGWVTKNPRPCRITNTLTGQGAIISVCEEDSIRRIQERFMFYNPHCRSYTWKYEGKALDLDLTLTENGIPDDRDRLLECGLPTDNESICVPEIFLFYNDDLTEGDWS
ncbi:hypothetical protein TKK_0006717 [Trichogramma kaykai]|uniref:Cytochrome b5 domain-containing protein 1 n=1 Tax=Trichogramma kaykai TaxID=54128 RepID=A0ABD2XDA6_9HYME